MKRNWLLILALVLVLSGSMLAARVHTAGDVQIKDIRFPGKDGKVLSALLYLPPNATDKSPAPAVLTMHGYINTRETQSGFNIEFARRGYVVLSMDMRGHGSSEQIKDQGKVDPSRGALSGLDYLASLAFVDKSNIATEGHSMGGWSTVTAAAARQDLVKTVMLQGSSSGAPLAPEVLADTKFNFMVNFSKYDEFAKLMWGVDKASDIVKTDKAKKAFGTTDNVIPGKMYGDPTKESGRQLTISDTTHPGDHLSKEAIGYSIDFLQATIPAPHPLPSADQVWQWKEFGTLVALAGFFLFLFAFGAQLLKASFFKSLVQPTPSANGARTGTFVVSAILATTIPAYTLFPFKDYLTKPFVKSLLGLNAGGLSATFPQQITTQLALWAFLNALIAIAIFLVMHFVFGRQNSALHYGLSTDSSKKAFSLSQIGKAALLAIAIVAGAHLLVNFVDWAFLVDFRWWVVAVKPISAARFGLFLIYLLPFVLFYLVSSLGLHSQRLRRFIDGRGLFTEMLLNGLISGFGIYILVALQVGTLFATEMLRWPAESLWGIIAYQFVPLATLTGMISTYFYRKTGNIYTGAFLNALFVTWYIVAGQAIQLGV